MSNPSLTPNTVAVGTQLPATAQDLVNFLAQNLILEGLEYAVPVIRSKDTPDVSQNDKLWIEVDDSGNPLSAKIFSSYWKLLPVVVEWANARPVTPSKGQLFYDAAIGTLLMYTGSAWVTADGVSGDLKYVNAADTATALAKNPGWVAASGVTPPSGYVAIKKS